MAQQRVTDEAGRRARREALLDAAERLLAGDVTAIPSVSAVAEAAGLAKGTVYLYFPSKECLLDALRERLTASFFDVLARLPAPGSGRGLDDVSGPVLAWLAQHPLFVTLAAHCRDAMGRRAGVVIHDATESRATRAAAAAAERLVQCADRADRERAIALMWQSLALVVGLAQVGRPHEIVDGMRTLWRGFGAGAP